MQVKNIKAAVIMLDGQFMIAPNAVVEVDGEHQGVQELIEKKWLEVVKQKPESKQKADAGETK